MIINQIVSGAGGTKIETGTVTVTSTGGPSFKSVAYNTIENGVLTVKQLTPTGTSFTINDVVIGSVLSMMTTSVSGTTITGGTRLYIHDTMGGSFHMSIDSANVSITVKGQK